MCHLFYLSHEEPIERKQKWALGHLTVCKKTTRIDETVFWCMSFVLGVDFFFFSRSFYFNHNVTYTAVTHQGTLMTFNRSVCSQWRSPVSPFTGWWLDVCWTVFGQDTEPQSHLISQPGMTECVNDHGDIMCSWWTAARLNRRQALPRFLGCTWGQTTVANV